MFGLGMTELLVIFGIALLLFGNRLPGVGRALGESIRDFRKSLREDEKSDDAAAAQGSKHALSSAGVKDGVIDIAVKEKQ